jgi:transposase
MPRPAPEIRLSKEEKETLLTWMRAGRTEQRLAERARVVLLAANGLSGKQIAVRVGTREARVSKWLRRFANERLAGLSDQGRSGKPPKYSVQSEERILKALDEPVPEGYSRWNGRLLAERLGNVSKEQVWRVMRKHDIQLERRKSWCVSTDPEFSRKAADIVGLYLNPPEKNAVVLCVDEKPHIQALERAQGWIRLPNGRALTGFSHEYKRHGTTTLFAALEIATGLVHSGHYRRRRRRQFLDFMNELVEKYPRRDLHVVLDNLNTHKPKDDRWLKAHPNVYFHFTPTQSCWLNQIECWFSILSRSALQGASFTSVQTLIKTMEAFIAKWNENAAPFEWTKREVHQQGMRHHYSNL